MKSIEQERAEYLSWISANYADIYSAEEAQMMWDHGHLSALVWKEQAARRASVVPQGWKLIKDATHEDRSYPEDSELENGFYFCTCANCGRQFTGHKRRVTCKACAAPQPPGTNTHTNNSTNS